MVNTPMYVSTSIRNWRRRKKDFFGPPCIAMPNRESANDNGKLLKRCYYIVSYELLWIRIGHVTIFSWMLTAACWQFRVTVRFRVRVRSRAVRRRRRPHVGIAPAPFSWRVNVMYIHQLLCYLISVMPYTIKLEQFYKNRKNDAGVFFDSSRYSYETWRRQSKVFSGTILCKWQLMLSYGTSYKIWFIKRMVQWKISTACTLITAYKVAKWKHRITLSARRIRHNILNVL